MPIRLTRRRMMNLMLAAAAAPVAATLPGAVWAQGTRNVEAMTVGDADAPVTLVEYAMFTCPHCKSFHENVYPKIKSEFIDTGKVQLIFREVYFNRASLWAGMIARCADPDRYFGLVDLLFEKQSEWTAGSDSQVMVDNLYGIGRQAGLTDEEMNACMSDQDFAEALVAEYQKNAQADGVDSTPTFVINGEKVSNMSYEAMAESLTAAAGG